jgi:hypothetical protein
LHLPLANRKLQIFHFYLDYKSLELSVFMF